MIDTHVHLWTDDRRQYPRAPGERDYLPERFTAEEFLDHARPCGVTRAVLVQMSFYRCDHAFLLENMRASPEVFSGIGMVDAAAPRPDEAMLALVRQGVCGFRVVAADLAAPGAELIWRCAAEHALPLCALVDARDLPALDRLCRRFPDTPVVVDHLARIGVDGTVRDADVSLLAAMACRARVYVKVSAFYALGRKEAPYTDLAPAIRRVFEAFGPQRLLWGSDCPFQVRDGHTYAASLALVRERLDFLSEQDREWLLSGTAASLFFR